MTSLIGRRLGRYELRAELGRGGMARVYRALDTLLQRQVAIKVLAAQLSLDPEFVRRFDREATTAANLRHPAIVTIYDVGEQEGLHYIAMELVSGRSLNAVLEERTTLGLGYAIGILEPVARALDYAHAQAAVHRDIKPHNILIDHDGRVLLTDFGIAQTPDSDGERLTRTGIFMGTPEYISPEQAEARRVDGRSDLYALGVVAYEIITGRVPFSGPTPQLIVAHAQLPPPPPTSVAAHLPGELDEVLTKALAKRPERRYATGQALIDALKAVAARYGTPTATRDQVAALADAAGIPPLPQLPQPVPAPPARPRPAPPPPDPITAARPTDPGQIQFASELDLPPAPIAQPQPKPGPRPQPGPAAGGPRPPTTGNSRAQTGSLRSYGQLPTRADASPLPLLLIGALLVLITGGFILLVARGLASGPAPFPTAAAPTPGLAVPSPFPASPTSALVSTMLPVPSEPPTQAPPPPPTQAPPPPPTQAPPPPPTQAPPLPPTSPPATLPPAAPTSTPEQPTATPSPEQPTATPSPEQPTATPSPEPSATITPTEETPILDNTPIVVTPVNP